jgi:aspartate--ammonia ligase
MQWTLNGDIMVMHPVTGYRHELSSMGIRVDREALEKQLEHRGMSKLLELQFHKAIMDGKLPPCIGGGIGISRLLMLLLQRGHIGEVQVCWTHLFLEKSLHRRDNFVLCQVCVSLQ